MTTEDAFIDDIRETPDDDVPRLIFADYLEDHGDADRAEFIRTQIYLARHPDAPLFDRAASRLRCEQLLEANWDRWVKPLAPFLMGAGPIQLSWAAYYQPESAAKHFRRGFVEEMETDIRFLRSAPELFRRQPIRHLRLHQADEWGDSLAACRQLRWVESLTFVDFYRAPITARVILALERSPHVDRLRTLGCARNYLGDAGIALLATVAWLAQIDWLDLEDNGISAEGLRPLVQTSMPFRPVRLSLSNNQIGDQGGIALAESPILRNVKVLSLNSCGLTELTAAALARSPHLLSLEHLSLQGITPSGRARELIDSAKWRPRLGYLFI